MALIIYGINNCDSMKKAFHWLNSNRIVYSFVDFTKEPPTEAQILSWLSSVGDSLVNKRGKSFHQLSDAVKESFSGQTLINAIMTKPTLIKRPLLVNGMTMTVGFDSNRWTKTPNLLTN